MPELGVAVAAQGPLARDILGTFTRSPRSVALAPGPAGAIPIGWHTVTFEGLSLAAPDSWAVAHTRGTDFSLGATCELSGLALGVTGVSLDTDQRILPVPSCPARAANPPQPPRDGVQVDAGRFDQFVANLPLFFSTPCLHIHSLTICPATSPAFSMLSLKVTVPGRAAPVLVSIGLAGNGMVARTILYSLRAA